MLAERNFRLFFFGRLTSFIGTGMLPVALAFAVFGRGGSTSQVGFVLGAEWAPLAVFLLIGGVLADRMARRSVMVGSDVLRALAQGLLAAWILVGHPPLWGFLACEFVVGAGTAFFIPAMTGLIPEVASPARLQDANVFNSLAQWSGFLVGPAIAGIVVATAGAGWAVAADAISYAVSAACLVALRAQWRRGSGRNSFATELRVGWDAFRSRTWLWVIVSQFSFFGLFVFPAFFVLGAVVARDSLGGAAAWGAILGAQGAGSVLGTLSMLRFKPRYPLMVAEASLFGWVLPLALLAARAPTVAVAAAAFVAGVSFGVFGPLWDTTMQRELPPDVLSRASAYDWFGSFVFLPIGYALEGTFASLLGVTGALVLGAVWIGVTTVVVLAVPGVRRLRWSGTPPVAGRSDGTGATGGLGDKAGEPIITGHVGVG